MNKYWEILCRLFTKELFVECCFITSGKTLREALLFIEGKEDTGFREHTTFFRCGEEEKAVPARCTLHVLEIQDRILKRGAHFCEVNKGPEPVLPLCKGSGECSTSRGAHSTQCLCSLFHAKKRRICTVFPFYKRSCSHSCSQFLAT